MSFSCCSTTFIVSLERFSLTSYIIKEITITRLDGTFNHYLFAPPTIFSRRTPHERQTIQYTIKSLSKLDWADGDLPYSTLASSLESIEPGVSVLCHGNMARNFLKGLQPGVTVLDTSLEGNKFPKELGDVCYGRKYTSQFCSLAKAKYLSNNFKILLYNCLDF